MRILAVASVLALVFATSACKKEGAHPGGDPAKLTAPALFAHIPADSPYVIGSFEGVPPGLTRLGAVTRRIDRMVEDVAHAAYGYPGFFEPVRVDERRLELLYRADIAVAEAVQGVTAEVEAWTSHPDLASAGGSSLASLEVALELAESAWRTRREMLAEE